jgi:hypothetical protein
MADALRINRDDHLCNYMLHCLLKRGLRVGTLVEAYCPTLAGASKNGLRDSIFNKHEAAVASNDIDEKYDMFRICQDLPTQAPGVDTHERCFDVLTAEVCYRRNYDEGQSSPRDYDKKAQEVETDSAKVSSPIQPFAPSLAREINEALDSLYPHALRAATQVLKSLHLNTNHIEPEEVVSEVYRGVLAAGLLLNEIRQPCVTQEQKEERKKRIMKELFAELYRVAKQLNCGAQTRPLPRRGKRKDARAGWQTKEGPEDGGDDPQVSDSTPSPGKNGLGLAGPLDTVRDPNAQEPWSILSLDGGQKAVRNILSQVAEQPHERQIPWMLDMVCRVKQSDIGAYLNTSTADVNRRIQFVNKILEQPGTEVDR